MEARRLASEIMHLGLADEWCREGNNGVRKRVGDLHQQHRSQKRKLPKHLNAADQEQVY